jgi:hypothetical protein
MLVFVKDTVPDEIDLVKAAFNVQTGVVLFFLQENKPVKKKKNNEN